MVKKGVDFLIYGASLIVLWLLMIIFEYVVYPGWAILYIILYSLPTFPLLGAGFFLIGYGITLSSRALEEEKEIKESETITLYLSLIGGVFFLFWGFYIFYLVGVVVIIVTIIKWKTSMFVGSIICLITFFFVIILIWVYLVLNYGYFFFGIILLLYEYGSPALLVLVSGVIGLVESKKRE